MRGSLWVGLLAGLLALGGVSRGLAEVKVKKVDYHGWKDVYRMENGTVDLIFVPQIGRILRYGYLNGENILFENRKLDGMVVDLANPGPDWTNFGGDKLWPAPQSRWNWPPDPALDAGAHTVRVTPAKSLIVTGLPSKKLGLRFSREIILDATGTGVTLKNRLTNVGKTDVEWSVWQVTQVFNPHEMRLPIHKGGRHPNGYYVFKDADPQPGMLEIVGEEVRLMRHPAKSCKIGGNSPQGWISARRGNTLFTVSMTVEPGANYPDDGCCLEIWSNPDPLPYIELELLSPIQNLKPRQSYTFTTRWKLSRNE